MPPSTAYLWTPPHGHGHSTLTLQNHALMALTEPPSGITAQDVTAVLCVRSPHVYDPVGDARYWIVPDHEVPEPYIWEWTGLRSYLIVQRPPHAPLTIPHTDQRTGPGPHWVIPDHGWPRPSGSGPWVIDPSRLIVALVSATNRLGPPSARCYLCAEPVQRADHAWIVIPPEGLRPSVSAHPTCARTAGFQPATDDARWHYVGPRISF